MSEEKIKYAIAANGGTIKAGHFEQMQKVHNVIRCRECLKTSQLRRIQHFYLCDKHYKEWKTTCY